MQARTLFVCTLLAVLLTHALGSNVLKRAVQGRLQANTEATVKLAIDSVVDLYIGAMDEEAYFTLKEVLKAKTAGIYTDVIVFERSSKAIDKAPKAMLFERPLEYVANAANLNDVYYAFVKPTDPGVLTSIGTNTAAVCTGGKYACDVVSRLTTNVKKAGLAAAWANLVVKLKYYKPKSNMTPDYHIYTIGAPVSGSVPTKVAVILRIPEMGLQPDVVWPTAEPLVLALKKDGETKINSVAIAAGGVTSSGDKPGSKHLIHKSVFVGLQVKPDGSKVAPFVGLATDSTPAVPIVFTEKPPEDLLAADYTTNGFDNLNTVSSDTVVVKAKEYYQDVNMSEDVKNKLKRASLTLAFFGGTEEKTRANALDIHDVNMEDYFYLLIPQKARSGEFYNQWPVVGQTGPPNPYPRIHSMGVFRVDCDPYDVTPFTAKFNAWAKDQTHMTVAALKLIIKWGFAGLNMDAIPEELKWDTYLEQSSETKFSKALLLDKDFIKVGGAVVHPYLIEVATDLVKDCSSGDAVDGSIVEDPKYVVAKAKAATLLADKNNDGNLDLFLTAWADFMWTARATTSARKDVGSLNKVTNVPIWVRPKWNTYLDCTGGGETCADAKKVPALEFFKANDLGVDRTFYKSSNLAGLKMLNEVLFADKKVPYDFVVRQVGCAEFEKIKTSQDFCTKTANLKEMLGRTTAVGPIYSSGTCAGAKVAAITALSNFCDDDKAGFKK